MPKRIDACGYVRMSDAKQETSPDQQRTEIKRYAKQHNYRIVRWYQDDGISGDDTEKRVEFRRMIADASTGEFEAILCWDQDRFGRFDIIEAGRWISPLRNAGVHLATVVQGLVEWNTFAGKLIWSIQQEQKHQYLRDLSRNVARGMGALAQQGKWPGGRVPYGYTVGEDRCLYPGEPEQVNTVRYVFEEYAKGHSLRALCEELASRYS